MKRTKDVLPVDVFTELLKQNLPGLHKARLTAVAIFVLSLISEATVNLQKLSLSGIVDNVKADSLYKRFSRLLIWVMSAKINFGQLVLKLTGQLDSNELILCMDRTNWKYGKRHINFLVVSLYFNGVGYPIAWRLLPQRTKRGNSDTSHRILLMKKVLKLLKPTQIKCLLMDKEFIGEQWFQWINEQKIPFIGRIRDNALVNQKLSVKQYRKTLSRKKLMKTKVTIYGQEVYLSCKVIVGKNRRSELLFTVSNQLQGEPMLDLYADRWSIEQMFSHWKKRGFDFESTHITKPKRLMGLISLIALAYTIVHLWGVRLNNKLAIKKKKHGYLAKSIFRYGLDNFRHTMRILKPGQTMINDILKIIFNEVSFVR
jgi:transposase